MKPKWGKVLRFVIQANFAVWFFAPLHGEEIALPQNTTIDHYQAIWVRSPFTAASVTPEDKASGSWALVGLAGSKEDPLVFLQNRETQERMTVTKQSNDKGFQVLSMEAQTDLGQSTAHIHTPAQDLVVTFDKDLMAISNPPTTMTASNVIPPMFKPGPSNPGFKRYAPPNANRPQAIHHIDIPSPPPPPSTPDKK
jgi:hypothetical protein